MKNKLKRIEWAYPTSPSAVKFGFPRTGCWVVYVGETRVAGFGLVHSAVKRARMEAADWCPLFIQYAQKDIRPLLPELFSAVNA